MPGTHDAGLKVQGLKKSSIRIFMDALPLEAVLYRGRETRTSTTTKETSLSFAPVFCPLSSVLCFLTSACPPEPEGRRGVL